MLLSEAEISSEGWDGTEPIWTLISVDVLDITALKIKIHKVRLNIRAESQGRGQSQLSAPQSPSPGCECF